MRINLQHHFIHRGKKLHHNQHVNQLHRNHKRFIKYGRHEQLNHKLPIGGSVGSAYHVSHHISHHVSHKEHIIPKLNFKF